MTALAAVPLTAEQAGALARGESLTESVGYAVTPPMLEAFDLQPGEQAEFVALMIARVAGLLHDSMIIITAELPALPTEPTDFGAVRLEGLRLRDLSGVFIDSRPDLAARAAASIAGEDLDAAWESPLIQLFLADNDLLWHASTELPGLTDFLG